MSWEQTSLSIPPKPRGFHLITPLILDALPLLGEYEAGLLNLFLLHTSASLTVTENADPDVLIDLECALNAICPENFPYIHSMEGPDDMPAHVKSSLLGVSLTIPVSDGSLVLGTWQGVYLGEHRNRAGSRRVILTLQGVKAA